MSVLKQVGIVVLGCVLAGAMAVLGVWQLRVYAEQGAAASAARAAQPPVPLARVAPAATRVTEGYGLSVELTGTYDAALQVLVPLSGPDGAGPDGAGGQRRVVSGLRQPDGSVVAVARGLVPASTTTPPAPPTGEVTQVGVLLPSEEAIDGAPVEAGRLPSVRVPLLAQTWPGPMVDGYVVLSAADAKAAGLPPAPLVLPEGPGRLRNGAYAAQWWIFGAFAVGMSVKVARDLRRTPGAAFSDR